MTSSKTVPGRTHDTARRWRVPPAPLAASSGPEGVAVLEEVPGSLGARLWRALRLIATWAEIAPESRGWLAPEGRRPKAKTPTWYPIEIEPALRTLDSLLDDPDGAERPAISEAALAIAVWARTEGFGRTAAEFGQVAAAADPERPSHALAAARATRDLADYARGEAWFQRAIGLARATGDWTVYIRGYLGYGKLLWARGNVPGARKHFERAHRRAARVGNRELQGMALHDLLVIESTRRRWEAAETYAALAIDAYPAGSDDLPRLCYDIAYCWLRQGRHAESATVLTRLLPIMEPRARPAVLGGLAHAAGGSADARTFEEARSELVDWRAAPGVAEAWLDIARGAMHLGRIDEARAAARTSREIAAERSEHRIVFEAEALEESCASLTKDVDVEEAAHHPDPAEHLAERVVRKLATV